MELDINKALVVFSGGQDSSTCLFWALKHFSKVHTITFSYGQRHALEVDMARRLAEKAGVDFHLVDAPLIGTLGAGVQLFNPSTGRFATLNKRNSGLKSDYVASVVVEADGNVIIGHSQGVAYLDVKTMKVTDGFGDHRKGGTAADAAVNTSVNQVCRDSRGLVWVATISGLKVYDRTDGRLYTVNLQGKHIYSDVCPWPKAATASCG